MKTGISIYFSNSIEKNEDIIKKAVDSGVTYAFTSLHIPEENQVDYRDDIRKLMRGCKEGGLQLVVDVGPETLEKLGVSSIDALMDFGITHIRLDYGFTAEDTVRLAEKYHIVFNASTITDQDIRLWKEAGADFTRFAACHNFYPKQFTALSIERVSEINRRLKYLGFTTMAFVPGNLELRGPLFEGLPTVEAHRNRKNEVLLNMLELYYDGGCDVVLIGDVDIENKDWKAVSCLNLDYLEMKADIYPQYAFVRDIIHHDRPDSSEQVIRSQESRQYKMEIQPEETGQEMHREESIKQSADAGVRKAGSIFISNQKYLRYTGELEIARINLPKEERVNIIGQVAECDKKYLPYIRNGFGVKLI